MVLDFLPPVARANVFLAAVALTRIPLIMFVRPVVVRYDDDEVTLRIPLGWRTRNHVGSMYIGALCTGADCAGGLMAMDLAWKSGNRVKLVFRDMRADFLKRCDGDTWFTCRDGQVVRALVDRALRSGERESATLTVVATVPSRFGDEPVARFAMQLSARAR
ncbi:MAG: DUF4442 domain-containing protein [Myxococcota bacterium]